MTASLKEQRKQAKKEARARFKNPYKEGDILHHSWGYDQTNCDFYQVVESKPVSVVLKKIGTTIVTGSEGFMSERLMPVKDNFIEGTHALTKYSNIDFGPENPTITKKVSFYVNPEGALRYYIPTPYGWCDLWDGRPGYSSHYA